MNVNRHTQHSTSPASYHSSAQFSGLYNPAAPLPGSKPLNLRAMAAMGASKPEFAAKQMQHRAMSTAIQNRNAYALQPTLGGGMPALMPYDQGEAVRQHKQVLNALRPRDASLPTLESHQQKYPKASPLVLQASHQYGNDY